MATELRAKVAQALDNRQGIRDIVAYCANSFATPNMDKGAVIDQAKEYLRDTTNAIGDHLINLSDSLTSVIEQQLSSIDDARHRVNSISTVWFPFPAQLTATVSLTVLLVRVPAHQAMRLGAGRAIPGGAVGRAPVPAATRQGEAVRGCGRV